MGTSLLIPSHNLPPPCDGQPGAELRRLRVTQSLSLGVRSSRSLPAPPQPALPPSLPAGGLGGGGPASSPAPAARRPGGVRGEEVEEALAQSGGCAEREGARGAVGPGRPKGALASGPRRRRRSLAARGPAPRGRGGRGEGGAENTAMGMSAEVARRAASSWSEAAEAAQS